MLGGWGEGGRGGERGRGGGEVEGGVRVDGEGVNGGLGMVQLDPCDCYTVVEWARKRAQCNRPSAVTAHLSVLGAATRARQRPVASTVWATIYWLSHRVHT